MTTFPGTLHQYSERLVAFEFGPQPPSRKVLVFVGGLGDGLLTVPYVPALANAVAGAGWSLVQALISSSYIGYGTGSLQRDAAEIAQLVKYLRSPAGGNRATVVVAGHSTGCQDIIQYLTKPPSQDPSSIIDGGILQAPASDREALLAIGQVDVALTSLSQEVHDIVAQNNNDLQTLLPSKFAHVFFGTPMSAYRWLALTEKRGDDDFFSSDLDDADYRLTFGKVGKPLLIAVSEKDESVPDFVDKEELARKFGSFVEPRYLSKYSGIVKGASHTIMKDADESALEDFLQRVMGFLREFFD